MKSKDQILTKEAFEQLWNVAKDPLDKLILVCGGMLGMRVSEISKMNANWIDFQEQKIRIPTTAAKTDKSARSIPYRFLSRAKPILEAFFTLQSEVGMTRQAIGRRV